MKNVNPVGFADKEENNPIFSYSMLKAGSIIRLEMTRIPSSRKNRIRIRSSVRNPDQKFFPDPRFLKIQLLSNLMCRIFISMIEFVVSRNCNRLFIKQKKIRKKL